MSSPHTLREGRRSDADVIPRVSVPGLGQHNGIIMDDLL